MRKFLPCCAAILLSCSALFAAGPVPVKRSVTAMAKAQDAARTKGPHGAFGRTPFDRQMLPSLQKLTRDPATAKAHMAAVRARVRPADYQGFGINFPGFYAAPYMDAAATSDTGVANVSASADFTGDGFPDIVTLPTSGTLNLLTNDGKGNLTLTYSNNSAAAKNAELVYGVAADLNGDGFPDVVAEDVTNNAIVVWLNKGNGTFADAVFIPLSPSSGASLDEGGSFAVGDVNGDGKLDVVVIENITNGTRGNYTSTFTEQTLLGNGDGTFQPATEHNSTVPGEAFLYVGDALKLFDTNNDGKLDLVMEIDVISSGQIFISTAAGNGDGTFAAPQLNGPNVSGRLYTPSTLQLADVNKDGIADVVFSIDDGNIYVCAGKSDGTFGPVTIGLSGAVNTRMIKLADFNGDGTPDIAAFREQLFAVYTGNGDGTFQAVPSGLYAGGADGWQEPDPRDFNGDGKPDAIYTSALYGKVITYINKGGGQFVGAPGVAPADRSIAAENIGVVTSGDFNADGYSDAVAYDFTNSQSAGAADIDFAFGSQTGDFTFKVAIPAAQVLQYNIQSVEPVTGDFNGDGRADLILGGNGGLMVALTNGDGSVSAPIAVPLPNQPQCPFGYVDVGDVNGDGKLDIVAPYSGDAGCGASGLPSGFYVMLGDGTGHFKTAFTAFGTQLYEAKLADWSGDGKLDLGLIDMYIDPNSTANNVVAVYLLPGDGAGNFDANNYATPSSGSYVSDIVIGDYNNDGYQDLTLMTVGTLDGSGQLDGSTAGALLYPGRGNFNFGDPTLAAQQTYAIQGKYADFNGDGNLDLTFSQYENFQQNASYFGLVTLPNLGKGIFAPALNEFLPQLYEFYGPQYTIVGDFNGDGAPDVIAGAFQPSIVYFNKGATTISLSASPQSVPFGSTVTISGSITPGPLSATPPAGTVTLYDNGNKLATAAVLGSDTFQIGIPFLSVGTHAITATYSGDDSHNQATSTAVTVTVTPATPAITISSTPGSVSVAQGQTGVVTLAIGASGGFAGAVSLACSGMPAQSTCTLNPASVTVSGFGPGGAQNVTLVTATTAPNNHSSAALHGGPSAWKLGGISLAALLPWILARKRLPRVWMIALFGLLSLAGAAAVTGCSDGYKYSGTPPGTYQVQITATGTSGGTTVTQTFNLPLTVTK